MNWRNMALTPIKDKPMPETKEHYLKMLALDDELIHEQRVEISKLRANVNKLEQKINSQKSRNKCGYLHLSNKSTKLQITF